MENPFKEYIATVQELVNLEGKSELASYINEANIEVVLVNHDNWNGGIDFYNLVVNIPVKVFARMRAQLDKEEKALYEAFMDTMHDADESLRLSAIKIVPNKEASSSDMHQLEDISMWKYNYYRLFISHLTSDKERATYVKNILMPYGIHCFVAHEDITPSKEWQVAIESALSSMDALCAILSPDFPKSKWCDQEVGYALGRHKLVIPIDSGIVPYGFMGKWQAIKAKGKSREEVAKAVFRAICINGYTRNDYLQKLLNLIMVSKSKDEAIRFLKVLKDIEGLEKREIEILHSHYGDNNILYEDECLKIANELFEKKGFEKKVKIKSAVDTDNQNMDLPF